LQNSLQYSDGRVEIVDVPKAFAVGDMVAVTHRRDGGVVVQRVSPPLYSAGIEIYTKYTGLTPGTTYQIRFDAKIGKVQSASEPDYFYTRFYWWYGNAYDGHLSGEYETAYNGYELTTSWASYSTPEFICPYGGEVEFYFASYPDATPRNRLPVYFDNVEIYIGGSWVPMAGWSWTEEITTTGWYKSIIYGDIDADISDGYLEIDFTS